MVGKYNFGDINTGNLEEVEDAFRRAKTDITSVLEITSQNGTLDRHDETRLAGLNSYYGDFVSRLEALHEEYIEIEGVKLPNPDYETAKENGEQMLCLIRHKLRREAA